MSETTPTLGSILERSAEFLSRKGVANARGDARRLAAHGLGLDPLRVVLEFERPLADAEMALLRDLVARRGRGEPLQHLLGTVGFRHLEIRCDARALVPRPETEELVDLALDRLEPGARVHEAGVGTGCVALSLRHERASLRVTGSDLSPDALALAQGNARALGIWLPLWRADLLEGICDASLDAVVSNPPYIVSAEIPDLAPEVRRDPLLALDGGSDGLDLIRRLVVQAQARLKPGGWLLVEHGHDQGEATTALCSEGWGEVQTIRDLSGHDRFLVARRA